MDKSKPVSTPLDTSKKFVSLSDNEKPVDVQKYQMAIGFLTYATVATHPDLAAAIATLSKYMSRPVKDHWQAVKTVFRYIKGMMDYGFFFTAFV